MLDGAESADDLAVVLGVAGSCGVLITGRRHEATKQQDVGPLSQGEAVQLLQIWGQDRADDEDAAGCICELAGRLPLAVFLAGSYLARRQQQAREYLAWLEATPLEALDLGRRQHESIPVLLCQEAIDGGKIIAGNRCGSPPALAN